LDCALLEQAWARFTIADIAVIVDIARDRGKPNPSKSSNYKISGARNPYPRRNDAAGA
jgi:hypothetical protein